MKILIALIVSLATTLAFAAGDQGTVTLADDEQACLERELDKIDGEVADFASAMNSKYGEGAASEEDLATYREDLVTVSRIKARACIAIEKSIYRGNWSSGS